MDPSTITPIANILSATGPYGLVVVLSWAIWKVLERKDRELKSLSQKVIALAEAQTAAILKMESAMVALKKTIEDLASR